MSELPDLTGHAEPLVLREGERISPASPDDQAVVQRYPEFTDKGPVIDGYRLTVLFRLTTSPSGEMVRVFHVCESMSADRPLYVMGPKPVLGEYIDDQLASDPSPSGGNPLSPSSYNGRVVPGPGIDTNYGVTEYRFDQPGRHSIQWRMPPYLSNVAWVEVSGES